MTTDGPKTDADHFRSEVEDLTHEYHESIGVPAWILSVELESIAEDLQREAND